MYLLANGLGLKVSLQGLRAVIYRDTHSLHYVNRSITLFVLLFLCVFLCAHLSAQVFSIHRSEQSPMRWS